MKIIQIIHNPTAGDGQHSKESLIQMVKAAGHESHYVSTDETSWKDFHVNDRDAFLVAGGDGTVRKLAVELLNNPLIERKPILLLPLGTANNISETLGITPDDLLSKLDLSGDIKKFSCGNIKGLNSEDYFLEGLGFGVFPSLIEEMENIKIDENPAGELQITLQVLLDIVKNYKANKAKIKADGMKIKGSFLLVELLNIQNIGPNLKLAPFADPADDYLELVMIPEEAREDFANYIKNLIANNSDHFDLNKFIISIRAKKVKMKCKGSKIHVDDKLVQNYSGKTIKAEIIPKAFEFII